MKIQIKQCIFLKIILFSSEPQNNILHVKLKNQKTKTQERASKYSIFLHKIFRYLVPGEN